MGGIRPRAVATLAGATLLAGIAMAATAPVAAADVSNGKGYETVPAQTYRGNPDASDWIGSYLVNGQQVFCVQFAFKAPDSDEPYRPGEALRTKWGTDLAPDVAADISYLLLRYGNTSSADNASALAHLLHSWTAAPQNPGQLDPANDFRHIAYDVDAHFVKLPESARAAVQALRTEAAASRGPWTASLTAPTDPQLIGNADDWTVDVRNAAGKGVGGVPVTVTLTDATLEGAAKSGTVETPHDGSPLALKVTPTGENPSVSIKLASPAEKPTVRDAHDVATQRIVSTGGEKELTANAITSARTPPGVVRVTKTDAKSGAAIAGATLRLTTVDKASPVFGQDNQPLVDQEGKPVLLTTGADGAVSVPNLKTPQEVCLEETAAPAGYEQSFDPKAPPTACGLVRPGHTLELSLTNAPNLPKVIPAGLDDPSKTAIATAGVVSVPNAGALAGIGAALLITAGLAGFLWRRRTQR